MDDSVKEITKIVGNFNPSGSLNDEAAAMAS
jgi:hypothetical protein